MQGEIKLGDRGVSISANASFLLVYLSEFGEDIFPDLIKTMGDCAAVVTAAIGYATSATEENAAVLAELSGRVDVEKSMRLIWSLIKNADKRTPNYRTWAAEHTELDVVGAMLDAIPILQPTIVSTVKSKTTSTTKATGSMTTHLIMVAITARGMTVSDMERFTIGQCTDFVIEWNNLHAGSSGGSKEKPEPVRVRAGQREWDSFGL